MFSRMKQHYRYEQSCVTNPAITNITSDSAPSRWCHDDITALWGVRSASHWLQTALTFDLLSSADRTRCTKMLFYTRLYPFSLKVAICLPHDSHPRLNESGSLIVQLHGEKASLLALSLSLSGNGSCFPQMNCVCVCVCVSLQNTSIH